MLRDDQGVRPLSGGKSCGAGGVSSVAWCLAGACCRWSASPARTAHIIQFDYNDVAGLQAAAEEAGDDLRHHRYLRHDFRKDQNFRRQYSRGAPGDIWATGRSMLMVMTSGRDPSASAVAKVGAAAGFVVVCWVSIANGHSLAAVTALTSFCDAVKASCFLTGFVLGVFRCRWRRRSRRRWNAAAGGCAGADGNTVQMFRDGLAGAAAAAWHSPCRPPCRCRAVYSRMILRYDNGKARCSLRWRCVGRRRFSSEAYYVFIGGAYRV